MPSADRPRVPVMMMKLNDRFGAKADGAGWPVGDFPVSRCAARRRLRRRTCRGLAAPGRGGCNSGN